MPELDAQTVSAVFAGLLALHVVVALGLSQRQIAHVAARRDTRPAAFAASISEAAHAKAADYTCAKERFGMLQCLFGTALLLLWTFGGGLAALNGMLLDFFGGDTPGTATLAYQVALVFAFSLIGAILELPFEWYAHFRIEARFGFNRMTLRLWLTDLLKGALVGTVIGVPLLAMVLALMGFTGALWWLWAWALWMGFNLVLLIVYPLFIAPLFNEFRPLADATLAARVQALLDRCGFAAKGVFVMDGSKRSAQSNAYFTGLGRGKRVVLYDTLLSRLSGAEVEAVLAHELGHFRHRHILKMLLQIFALSLLALAALGWLSQQPAFFIGLGVTPNAAAPNDALALLLFLLVLPSATFLTTPLARLASRRHEFEADAYARRHASGADLASALVKLAEDNALTLTPDPLYVRFYYSHPPIGERLAALHAAPA